LSVIPIKFSILALYHRLFPSAALFRWILALGALTLVYSIIQAICMGLQCVPLSKIWVPNEPGYCIKIDSIYTSMAVLNLVTDILILALPIPSLWSLKLATARKVQLYGVFALGGCVCAFGVVRAVFVGTASHQDQSWTNVAGAIWSEIEICVGVLSACLPCMRPLFPNALRGTTFNSASKDAPAVTPNALEMSRRSRHGWAAMHDNDTEPFTKRKSMMNTIKAESDDTISEEGVPVSAIGVRTEILQTFDKPPPSKTHG